MHDYHYDRWELDKKIPTDAQNSQKLLKFQVIKSLQINKDKYEYDIWITTDNSNLSEIEMITI